MGTGTTKIGSIIEYIKNSYKRLGEYDVEEIDINDFTSNNISNKEYMSLKKALDEVEEMEKNYNADKKQRNNSAVRGVSNSETTVNRSPKKTKTKTEQDKDRED